jgi:myo-inositol-hexaphosphate 3-phosphohydrolase
VESGKATITTTTLKGVTIPAKTKGNIVEEDGNFYFVFKEKEYQKVGRIPLNVNKGNISIKVEKILRIDDKSHQKYKLKMVGTRLIVDTNDPGFELRIKEDEKTESIKETN